MEKKNPLLPFAFTSSSFSDEIALNTTPRTRNVIDENAGSMYHTRRQNSALRPALANVPSLKRKVGASFNENDDVKRRETVLEDLSSDPTFVDEDFWNNRSKENDGEKVSAIPSSPPLDHMMYSELDLSTKTNSNYHVPDSPNRDNTSERFLMSEINENDEMHTKKKKVSKQLVNQGSDPDFGIDKFNRFRHPINKCPSTDKDNENEEFFASQKSIESKARQIVLEAFENMDTTINLEGLGLQEVPDEIKDMNNLVIFEPNPLTKTSYQLYLTNNGLKYLPPSLFKFTKLNVLGLRQNKLERLPQLIGYLENLTDLYIGTNRLEFLPPQILSLSQLQTFRAGPNPFLKVCLDAKEMSTSTLNSYMYLRYVSPVKYFGKPNKKVPTLKCLCLNVVAKYDVSYQETKSWKRGTPKIYHDIIAKAIWKGQYEEKCNECNITVVEPFAEVIEWWDILLNKDVPIKREFCSGRCTDIWKRRVLTDMGYD